VTRRFGTYHLAGPEAATWQQVLARCKELGGLGGTVHPQRSSDLHRPARRPRSSALTSVLVPNLGLGPFPPLDQALADLLGRS
jgi:dTDP-4-dehydrorhamnose reductase